MKEYVINSKKYGKQIVLLDDDDYERIITLGIRIHLRYDKTIKGFYVSMRTYPKGCTKLNGKDVRSTTPLHRWIVGCPKDKVVDHINRNTLDNRKCNLKVCSQFENNQNQSHNTSGKVGVTYDKTNKKFVAFIRYKRKMIRLGSFKTFEEAVQCRIKAEKKLFNYKGGDTRYE